MNYNEHSKFNFPKPELDEIRERTNRRNFVLIALTSVMSIYATGIALAVIV